MIFLMECSRCKKVILRYPCPHCGNEGEVYLGKEGGTGGGQPSN